MQSRAGGREEEVEREGGRSGRTQARNIRVEKVDRRSSRSDPTNERYNAESGSKHRKTFRTSGRIPRGRGRRKSRREGSEGDVVGQ